MSMIKRLRIRPAWTLRGYNIRNLPQDLLAGVIIAAVSIPISMGYVQIAGLPSVYGLYGSVFPILVFALLSTSPQFIFGVDAAPAAIVGAALLQLEVVPESSQALEIVPLITLFTAMWLLLFFFCGAGKLVNYISMPVMGGFITGICCTIVLMQLPKMMGGSSGVGELFELASHLIHTCREVHWLSLGLGLSTLFILLLSKKLIPKFPMAVVVMAAGAILSVTYGLKEKGVALLANVTPGLPTFSFPNFGAVEHSDIIGMSMTVAIVIMAETLLAENNFAHKNGYHLEDNQEILAFSMGNLAAAFTGCCPINGSVSRTTMGEQYGAKSQLTGIVAGLLMIAVLLWGSGFIQYLPVPVLTAIVVSALMGAMEFHLAGKLWRVNRTEFYIFMGAFLSVLFLGTIYGVIVGIILSFVNVIVKSADPPRCFLGILPGHTDLVDISKYKHIYPIEDIVIYRFSSSLFFANIEVFQKDIEENIKEDTKALIIDASAIGSIDVTAAERLQIIYCNLKKKNIKFYITEHIAPLNDQFRKLGLGYMIEEGAVRRTISTALLDLGIQPPYPIKGNHRTDHSLVRKRVEDTMQEFVWAFGADAEDVIEKQIHDQIERLKETKDMDSLFHGSWHQMASMDEDEWLEHLEAHLTEIVRISGADEDQVAGRFEKRRQALWEKLKKEHPELAENFEKRRQALDEHLKQHHPEVYEKVVQLRNNLTV